MEHKGCETCNHPWESHYDWQYCTEENCGCGPCHLCGIQYLDTIPSDSACKKCKELAELLESMGLR